MSEPVGKYLKLLHSVSEPVEGCKDRLVQILLGQYIYESLGSDINKVN